MAFLLVNLYVSLQFWTTDTTFLTRGLLESKQNLRFATVLDDRHHDFSERVAREQMKYFDSRCGWVGFPQFVEG